MVFENEVNLYGDAPIASKFSSQDTRFDVIQGHINAIISESEMIELLDGGKTMYSGMNDIKIDVTGLHGNISSLSTTVDGQTQQITEINSKQAQYEATLDEFSASLSDTQSDLETTSQNLATLQLDTNQFKTTVSNTYSTKTQAQGYATSAQNAAISAAADDATSKANAAEANANAATDNKLRNYSTTSSVSSMIDQKADEITTSVSRSYATKDEAQTAARTTITGDTIYYLAYASNTGVTTSTSGWTTNPTASSAQISESKKYLWTYHKYTYGDGHTSDTTPVVTGTFGTQGATISSTTYQQGSSPTTAPTGTWSSMVPSVAEGKYLWTKITYTDGNVSYSVAKQGVSGTSVTVSKTEYQAGTSPTSAPTGSWSTSIPTVADGNYLWTKVTYSDSNVSYSVAKQGQQGTSVTVLKTEYQSGTSPTSAPTGSWSTSIPSVAEGNYLWTKVTYSDDSVSYSVAKQGVSGASVTVLKTEYQAGTSPTSAPTGTWSPTIPSVADGNYLWTKVTYSDNNVAYSVAKQGQKGDSVTVRSTEYQAGSSPTSAPTGSWSSTVPSVAEGNYLWTRVTYSDNNVAYSVAKQGQSGTSVTVSGTEYAYKLSENGTSPPTGTWSTTPVAPTSTQYAWTRTTTTFSDRSTAVTYTVGGKKGDTGVGISKVTPLYYAKNNNTAPAKPTSKITTTTINTGVWTTALPSLTNTYKYLFTCDQIEYDDSSSHVEWTTVVEDKNISELYTRLTTAEQKITDSAIIQTVTASGQFPAKGDIILSINEVSQSQAYISADKINLTAYSTGAEVEEMANCDYVGDVAPTTSNYPASEWVDDDAKIAHIGDTYYRRSTNDKYYFKGIPEQGLLIRFDNRSETEQTHDYVYIYYRLFGNLYRSRKFSGSIGGATFYIPSGEFWVYWHSDTTVSDYYGFSFSALSLVSRHDLEEDVEIVSNLPNYYATVTNTYTDMASPHSPYLGGANKVWKYVRTDAISTGVFCSWVASAVKRNFDTKTTVMLTSNGLTSKVSAGDIASTINQTAQSVLIDAQKINLNGYLTVTDVGDNGSTIISGSRIRTGKVNADYVYGGTLSGSQIECSGYNYKTAITHASNGGFIRVYYRKTQTGIFESCGSIQGYDSNGNKAMIFNAGSGVNREVSIECNEHYFTIDSSGVIATDCHLGSSSSKSRFVATEDYGERILYCYETPTPTFGDIGEGTIGDDGMCYIFIEPIFAETVTLNQYQVFLQKYGDGECYVSERKSDHFVVCGTVGLSFSWEIKAKQLGYDQKRLDYRFKRVANGNTVDYVEEADRAIEETETIDYAEEAINHINEIAEERKVA